MWPANKMTVAAALLLIMVGVGTAHAMTSLKPEVEIKRDMMIMSFVRRYSEFLTTKAHLDISASLIRSSSSGAITQECEKNFIRYMSYLNLLFHRPQMDVPSWVLELFDATGKPPTGILEGNLEWLGSFTECLKVRAFEYNTTAEKFRGQYCTAVLASSSTPPPNGAANYTTRTSSGSGDPSPGISLSLGVCWPSSCTAPEIAQQLNFLLSAIANTMSVITVDQQSCYVQEATTYSSGSIFVIFLLIDFALLMLIGTVYEVATLWRRTDAIVAENTLEISRSVVGRILLSFSIYKNGKKILSTSSGEGSFSCLHGIRFLTIVWEALGHCYAMGAMMPFKNALDLNNVIRHIAFDTIMNGTFSTDTFFFMSGFLVAYLFLKEMKQTGGQFGPFKIILFYFHRYWRLTPALAMSIAIAATLYQDIWNGPEWKQFYADSVGSCQTFWWRTLLYIQNLYDVDHQCYPVSWYLACDMQFYLVSLLIIYPLYRNQKVGFIILAAFLLASMITSALIIHFEDLKGFELPDLPEYYKVATEKRIKFQTDVYIKPYCRMSVYCIGIAMAVLLHRTSLTVKLNPMVVGVGWLTSTVLGLTLVYGTHDYFTADSTMSNGLSSVYGACSRPAWALVVAWVIFACVTGHGGYVNTILSWKAFMPLSKLTYCCYLVHLLVLEAIFGSQQNVFYFNQTLMTTLFLGFLVMSILVAFVFSLAFEAPMMELEKIFLPSRRDVDAPSLLNPKIWNDRNDVVATIESSTSSSSMTTNQTRWRPITKAYQNNGFDVDTRTFYDEEGRPSITTL